MKRLIGIPWLFAVGYLAVGFSLYFSLGIVAERGLGLTPLIFLGAGIMFVLTTFSYTEGGAMYAERGGSNTFARYAFNELVSFIAGWAVLIDYIIIVAIAAITVPHYLTPIAEEFGESGGEIAVAAAVIVGVSIANVIGSTGALRRRLYVVIALADFALQIAVIVVGAVVVLDPALLTDQLDPFTSPALSDAVYAAVIATVALAGIEAASGLAPDLDWDERGLRRVVNLGLVVVPILYAAIAAVALMAVPVVPGPDGPTTALGGEYSDAPVLGVVQSFDPAWVADTMQWAVVLVAPAVLIWAASISMLGLSRHVYTLATNRQIPSWLGKLGRRTRTPYIAIWVAAVIALGLRDPHQRGRARRPLCVRHHARRRDRAPLGHPPALHGSRAPARVSRPVQCPVSGRFAAAAGGAGRRRGDRGLGERDRDPRRGALAGRRVDALRAARLRRLSRAGRGDVADQARQRARRGLDQGAGGGRVSDASWSPCSARRSTTTSSARPVASPPRPTSRARTRRGWRSSSCSTCRSRSLSTRRRRPSASSRPSGRSSGRATWAASTTWSTCTPT